MDTGADSTLINRNPDCFQGPKATIEGYGGRHITVLRVSITLGIGCLPPRACEVYASLIAKYMLGVNVLRRLTVMSHDICGGILNSSTHGEDGGKRTPPAHPSTCHRPPRWLTSRGHEEIGHTILKLEEAGVIRFTHSLFNSPVASAETRQFLENDNRLSGTKQSSPLSNPRCTLLYQTSRN